MEEKKAKKKNMFVTVSESLGAVAAVLHFREELSHEGIRKWQE